MSWYDFRNDGDDPFNFEYNLGIVDHRTFVPSPPIARLPHWLDCWQASLSSKQLDLGGRRDFAYRFVKQDTGESVIALWSSGDGQTIELPCDVPSTVVNLMDERASVEPVTRQDSIVTAARDEPVFLLWTRAK